MEFQQFNYLRDESSKYLKQHATSPVKWHPFGPEAIQKAKDDNKIIHLSIGYSTNFWCKLMSADSYSEEVVSLLNEKFICIKVDKHDHPDLDEYFQLACQVMNGRGGWPLNAFLTPDLKPFFIGTYFPKTSSANLPSFIEVIKNVSHSFESDSAGTKKNAEQIFLAINQAPTFTEKVEYQGHFPAAGAILDALKNYEDEQYGGYGIEPKLSYPTFLEWGIEQTLEGVIPDEYAKHLIFSVENMLMGGLFDQARGGIHRFSLKQDWSVPQFEKNLHDQAALLKLLSKVSLLYPAPIIFDAMIQTLQYLNSEMLSDENVFFSTQSGESEGVEGLYFSFSKQEFLDAIKEVEPNSDQEQFLKWFNITEEGNLENKQNVLSLNPIYKKEFYEPEAWNKVRAIKKALLDERKNRIPPLTDNKLIASWNFQLLTSLLDVIQYCKIESIQKMASTTLHKCLDPCLATFLYNDENKISRIHTTSTNQTHVPLFEDYIMFAELSFRCYEYSANEDFLKNASNTIDFIFKNFYKDKGIFTRDISFDDSLEYNNIHTPIFDQMYKSSLAILIGLTRKWSLHLPELKEYLIKLEPTIEIIKNLSLQNPLVFGESLRALIYPDEAYRKISVPKAWFKDNSIYEYFPRFSHRFAICSHTDDDQSWQIFTFKECELKGVGIQEFKGVFTSNNNEN